jgi:hypothetical protein
LKLRYMLPIVTPTTTAVSPGMPPAPGLPPSSPVAQKFNVNVKPTDGPPILFDALLIARKDEGWEDMLATAIERWTQAVAEERRGER